MNNALLTIIISDAFNIGYITSLLLLRLLSFNVLLSIFERIGITSISVIMISTPELT